MKKLVVTNDTILSEVIKAIEDHGPNVDLNHFDTSLVTDMRKLFSPHAGYIELRQLFNGNINKWDVSRVTNMADMFHGAKYFNQDISGWDTSSVTDIRHMFVGSAMEDKKGFWPKFRHTTNKEEV